MDQQEQMSDQSVGLNSADAQLRYVGVCQRLAWQRGGHAVDRRLFSAIGAASPTA
jgi:hypothetical protein